MQHTDEPKAELTNVIPPEGLDESQRLAAFNHFFRRLASHRDAFELYALADVSLFQSAEQTSIIDKWAQELLRNAWAACQEPGGGDCPVIDNLSDTSTVGLPSLPSSDDLGQLLTTILFLHVTSTKQYHAHTRAFLFTFKAPIDEDAIVRTLKNPELAIKEAERMSQAAKEEHAAKGRTFRMIGMGLGAIAGGVLVGISGGLAAPLVGAGVTTVLSWLGVGGSAAGLLASGLAGSSVVCGTLFGAYGSKKTAEIVGKYTREVRNLAIIPVGKPRDTLAVRLCVSGWLDSEGDVTAPWTIFGGDDTFAFRWEVDALIQLSNALSALVKSQAMSYVKAEVIKRTVFASLFAALSPTAWLKIGQIIDNPWMNAKSLAIKAGRVLGTLLVQRMLGNRPVTLIGYSLGSLVIFEALRYLASLHPDKTSHLVQDAYLFGTPISSDDRAWPGIRRVVAGRLVNGYGKDDYILAVLHRVSNGHWNVAGLTPVQVKGVENVECEEVDGHLKWRGMVGKCMEKCGSPGIAEKDIQGDLGTRKEVTNGE